MTTDLVKYRNAFEQALGVPFSDGNRVERLINGDEIFPAMLKAIREARHSIDFVTFVYWGGAIAEEFAVALAERPSRMCRYACCLMPMALKRCRAIA